MTFKLTLAQIDELADALLSAFPDRSDLERTVERALGWRLRNYVNFNVGDQRVIYNLIELTTSQGQTKELIWAASQANANPKVRRFVNSIIAAYQEDPGNIALQEFSLFFILASCEKECDRVLRQVYRDCLGQENSLLWDDEPHNLSQLLGNLAGVAGLISFATQLRDRHLSEAIDRRLAQWLQLQDVAADSGQLIADSQADVGIIQTALPLLRQFMQTESQRQTYLTLALGMNSPVLDRLRWNLSTQEFIVEAIAVLNGFSLSDGQPALCALLATVREDVGEDVRGQIDKLIQEVRRRR